MKKSAEEDSLHVVLYPRGLTDCLVRVVTGSIDLQVYLAQKMIIDKCNHAGKPVITATQVESTHYLVQSISVV